MDNELKEMQKLIEDINRYNYAYYTLDNPIISDKEWDALYNKLLALEEKTGVVMPDSPSQRVGPF